MSFSDAMMLVLVLTSISMSASQRHDWQTLELDLPNRDSTAPFPEDVKHICGLKSPHKSNRIIGGSDAAFGSWPWHIIIAWEEKLSRCAGSILNREWIATAANCLNREHTKYEIVVGVYDKRKQNYKKFRHPIRDVIINPNYNESLGINDIALIQLERPLKFSDSIRPICLPPDNTDLVGQDAVVTGWGFRWWSDSVLLPPEYIMSEVLQELHVPILEQRKCEKTLSRHEYRKISNDSYLCAGHLSGDKGSCHYDLGGPLQVRASDKRWFLAGIMSSFSCGEPNYVDVFTKVSHYKSWIITTINRVQQSKPLAEESDFDDEGMDR